jgi:D-3-phosphoglycerate dehydrogenase
MRILIADKFPESYVAQFRALGLRSDYQPDLSTDALKDNVGDASILVVRSTKVTRAVIEAASKLELILRAGAGVDTIDVAVASERGIYVANCPGKNSVAVAELAMGLILAIDRRIPHNTADLRAGKWNKKEYSKADGLKGKTLGIVGLGAIGQAVAKRAAAFEMGLCAYSMPEEPAVLSALGVAPCASLLDLAERADIVTVHVPQLAETKKLFGVDFFSRMKHGAVFINTSRGGVVDQPALERAMREKDIRAGLDVFDSEPEGATASFSAELFASPNFVGTHHIGASTEQAQNAIAAEAVRICAEFVRNGQHRAPYAGHGAAPRAPLRQSRRTRGRARCRAEVRPQRRGHEQHDLLGREGRRRRHPLVGNASRRAHRRDRQDGRQGHPSEREGRLAERDRCHCCSRSQSAQSFRSPKATTIHSLN